MSIQIEIPLGFVFRVGDENGFRNVACVTSPGYHECGNCVFRDKEGSCEFACAGEVRADRKEVIFVEVAGWEGGEK